LFQTVQAVFEHRKIHSNSIKITVDIWQITLTLIEFQGGAFSAQKGVQCDPLTQKGKTAGIFGAKGGAVVFGNAPPLWKNFS
jgi:hypothetical protein